MQHHTLKALLGMKEIIFKNDILKIGNKYNHLGCHVQPQLPQRLTVLLLPKKPENKLKPLCPVVTDVEPQ